MTIVWLHLFAALLAIVLGTVNLVREKGTTSHKVIGWFWIVAMLFVTLSSFDIRELNDGDFSWIHGLTLWTLFSMTMAIIAIRQGNVRQHAGFMTGTMAGAVIAGLIALRPGRHISEWLGYA